MVGGNGVGTSNPEGIDTIVSHASGIIQAKAKDEKTTEQLEDEEARLLSESDKGLAIKILEAKGKSNAEIEVELQTQYSTPESVRDFVASNHTILQEANFKEMEKDLEQRGEIFEDIVGELQKMYGDINNNPERWYSDEQRKTIRNLGLVDGILNAVPYFITGKKPLQRAQRYKNGLTERVAEESSTRYLNKQKTAQNDLDAKVKEYQSQMEKGDATSNAALTAFEELKSEFRDVVRNRKVADEKKKAYEAESKNSGNPSSSRQYHGMNELCSRYTRKLAMLTRQIESQEKRISSIEKSKERLRQYKNYAEDLKTEYDCAIIQLETKQSMYTSQIKDGKVIIELNRRLLGIAKGLVAIDAEEAKLDKLPSPALTDLAGLYTPPIKDHAALFNEGERYIANARRKGWLEA